MNKIKEFKIKEILSTYLFYASIFIFLIAFNFQDTRTGGWYQQWLPTGLGDAPVKDMVFTDSLNGYIIAGSPYLLKTTNGGDNWFVNQHFGDTVMLRNINFINKDSAVLCEVNSIYKTTNKGINWTRFLFPGYPYNDMSAYWMSALSFDSIWIACGTGFNQPELYLTTNGGLSWTLKFQLSSGGKFDKIYFYNKRIGFCCTYNTYKTTDGGNNWSLINPNQIFSDIYFFDSLTGWKNRPYKTTDGGLTWVDYYPYLPQTFMKGIYQFSKFNKDTIWGVGGTEYYNGYRAIVYRTTNGGINWGYQRLDTSVHAFRYEFCNFINKFNGWAYYLTGSGIHTNTGGNDTTFYTSIKEKIINISPKNFELKQNYPNPYNNSSLIEYYINEPGWVKLKIFDIAGKEIATLVNEVQSTGGYGIPVSVDLSSGVYFYKMIYMNRKGEIQMETKKMILLK